MKLFACTLAGALALAFTASLHAALARRFKARTPGLLALACLLVTVPATAQVNYGIDGNTAYVARGCGDNIVIASTYNGYRVTSTTSARARRLITTAVPPAGEQTTPACPP